MKDDLNPVTCTIKTILRGMYTLIVHAIYILVLCPPISLLRGCMRTHTWIPALLIFIIYDTVNDQVAVVYFGLKK